MAIPPAGGSALNASQMGWAPGGNYGYDTGGPLVVTTNKPPAKSGGGGGGTGGGATPAAAAAGTGAPKGYDPRLWNLATSQVGADIGEEVAPYTAQIGLLTAQEKANLAGIGKM